MHVVAGSLGDFDRQYRFRHTNRERKRLRQLIERPIAVWLPAQGMRRFGRCVTVKVDEYSPYLQFSDKIEGLYDACKNKPHDE